MEGFVKRHNNTGRSDMLACSLGWFGLGLGVSQVLAPRQVSRLIGVDDHPVLMRMLGIREIVSGLGIVAQDRPVIPLWSRVVGDAMDLALLAAALNSRDSDKNKLIAATAAVAGVTALDTYSSIRFTRSAKPGLAKSVITVNRSQQEVYEFWRDPNNMEQFIKSVPGGIEVVTARPNEFLEWRSADGWTVKSGSVTFTPAFGREGTEVRVVVDGVIPVRLLHEDVRRSKRLIETGEIPTTEGQAAGPRASAPVSRLIQLVEGKEVA